MGGVEKMQHGFRTVLLPLAAFSLVLTACSDDGDPGNSFVTGVTTGSDPDGGDEGGADDAGDDGGAETSGDEGGDTSGDDPIPDAGGGDTDEGGDEPPPDPGIESCSTFNDAQGLFNFVNDARADYGGLNMYLPHPRYKGIPWQGEGHENWTFSIVMDWDEDLAAQARAEAEALASGANPQGTQVNGQASIHNPMWIDGINTGNWQITVTEDLDDWQKDPNNPFSSDVPFALDKSNGSARLGLHYHDFGGDGPAINRLGVGGALGEGPGGDCQVWWVLQFGE